MVGNHVNLLKISLLDHSNEYSELKYKHLVNNSFSYSSNIFWCPNSTHLELLYPSFLYELFKTKKDPKIRNLSSLELIHVDFYRAMIALELYSSTLCTRIVRLLT